MSTHQIPHLGNNAQPYYIFIGWNGSEDKPFYKAFLASASHMSAIAQKPFWGYAALEPEDFNRLVKMVERNKFEWQPGGYESSDNEYYIEIEVQKVQYHCGIGFDKRTLNLLRQMAEVLNEHQQQPLIAVINRIANIFQDYGAA